MQRDRAAAWAVPVLGVSFVEMAPDPADHEKMRTREMNKSLVETSPFLGVSCGGGAGA